MSDAEKSPRTNRVKVSVEVDLGSYTHYALSKLENISIGGAFISTQDVKPVGTEVQIKFTLPDREEIIEATGRVVWIYKQRGKTEVNSSGMGIEFSDISEESRKKISEFVARHQDIF